MTRTSTPRWWARKSTSHRSSSESVNMASQTRRRAARISEHSLATCLPLRSGKKKT
eukprot:CAMPEP_0172860052 /NCGR_PEP_ID=MMETSP1075-20121228/71865_1 /TAXON_ID=2916 /ORGANISM="Ceratium fusus, Strain PA161109" /LENGTH=55 /DNA_ID=CAMNT_0013708031 /DNA_START=12 /DNA_END=175 /DNA_ORIENTATION=+